MKNVLYFQIYNECNKILIKKCNVQYFFGAFFESHR